MWELTLKCDHACHHCGSRAVKARPNELTTDEALKVVTQLSEMGAREVVLIGGEAYLHDGFLDIIRALDQAGITPVMTTGAMGVTEELAREMADAGLQRVSVSIDGLEPTHDTMRNRRGSFAQTTEALAHLSKAGTPTMGGALILFSVTLATVLLADLQNPYIWLVLAVTIAFGLIGFTDDFKNRKNRRIEKIENRIESKIESDRIEGF